MQIALYFGSFNPIHIGHLAIANYMVEYSGVDELWFVVSPQNPLKKRKSLLEDYHRYEMVYRAVEDDPRFRVSNIEFGLPKPSYTIDTLTYLSEKYPRYEFSLIIGADNLLSLHKWKNYDQILSKYHLIVYPRPESETSEIENNSNFTIVKAPHIELSSSFIRQAIKEGKNVRFFMPQPAWKYMTEMHFYEK